MSFFTIERARSSKRVTWLTLVGILLVPLAIGGLLVWALWNPTERLGDVKAAVVNLDQPVKIGNQLVPLGRELSAGLVDGKSSENYSWVLTDQKDAAAGLADGSYVTVVTIPKGFSKAATSYSGAAGAAKQATIDVQTSAKSKLVDSAVSQAVTTTATSVLNKQLTSTYLENVYVGFNTVHDQLSKAADGAGGLASGVASLASGTHSLASASASLAGGISTMSAGIQNLSGATSGLAGGLGQLQSNTAALPAQASQLAGGVQGVADGTKKLGTALTGLAAMCAAHGGDAMLCGSLEGVASSVTTGTGSTPGLSPSAQKVADGAKAFAGGLPALSSGIAQSASGASQLASGVAQTASGADSLASGAVKLSDGVTALAGGADKTSAGAATLATGLTTAVSKMPTYSSSDRTNLARVVAQPVAPAAAKAGTGSLFGASSIPLFAVVALWLGALATFLVLQAVSARALLTTRSSTRIALGGFLPAVAIGVAQGLLVAGIMQAALQLDVGHWFAFAGVAALTGIAFAAVNQGLTALLGGIGRFISMLVVVITLASGIISTVPGFFDASVTWLPTSAAITAIQGVIDGTSGVWRGLGALVLWAVLGLGMTVGAVVRRRTVRLSELATLD
ncbi:ABC transporter permease [Diaminobutyricibacter tongyongensis]|uniref:ABC transporter permease n=1 Tax=Leifsonia tongyongensis TaxID=1268043 RepID=A0A6L9XZE5_9MICO|nr:YhgE/Pip family protein [Diaminobutyricibacter tongyongensis]NEN06771.1 ABC transporter permease [Diaminobutyricibacter tongyongensis]